MKRFIFLFSLVLLCSASVLANGEPDLTSVAISNAKSNLVTPVRSIDSIFTRYPSSLELDQIILSADSLSILKLIQNLVSDKSLKCSQVMAYLLEVDGRIKSAIHLKTFNSDQLNVIIRAAEREISRLEREIGRLNGQELALFLDAKKSKLNSLSIDLEAGYRKYNAAVENIAPLEASVIMKDSEIDSLNLKAEQTRKSVLNSKLIMTEADSQIRQLEAKLAAANSRKDAARSEILFNERLLTDIEINIKNHRNDIANLERQIKNLKDQADLIRKGYRDIEVEAERLRSEVSKATTTQAEIEAEVSSLKDRIRGEEKKLVYRDLQDLNEMIDQLMKLQPGITSEINRQYYFCFGEGSVQIEQTGSVIIYIIRGEVLNTYIERAYQLPNVSVSVQGSVRLKPIDIFSSDWENNYGSLFPESTFESNKEIAMISNFWCLNPSALVSGFGQLTNVQSNYFTVQSSSGNLIKLNLSSCTRMETVSGSIMPKIGQKIYWRGVKASQSSFNTYTCTLV